MHKTTTSEEEESIFLPDEDVGIISEVESENSTDNDSKGQENLDNQSLDLNKKTNSLKESSGYGAIQRHLEKIEDRERILIRCMSPPVMPMASDVEDESMASTPGTSEFGEQLIQLQLLVQEMKDGFVLAMHELGRIQEWDKTLFERVQTSEKTNQRMINDVTLSVQQLKTDLSTAVEEVRKNSEMTKNLSEQMQQFQHDKKQLLEEIKQQTTMQVHETSKHKASVDSDNNNSDSGKPLSNGDSSKGDWEAGTTRGKGVSPMLQPFMDSLPDHNISSNMPPPCDSDSDSSATKAANCMLRMGNRTLHENYPSLQRQQTNASSDSDDPHNPDGKEDGISAKKDFDGASPSDCQRLQIAQELLSSEKTYVSQLSFLKEKIVNPLIVEKELSLSEINMMFPPCLKKLYQKHTTLLSTLESRLSNWKYQGMLGDIFARLTSADGAEFLQLYGKYMQNFSSSLSALSKQCNKSPKFQTFIKNQLSESSKEDSDITVYLMAPVQRIPAYVLCLKKLSKCTDSSHPDFFHVEHCLKQLSDYITTSVVDNPVDARKLSTTSQSSSEMSSSKRSKDSGIHSPDELTGGQSDNLAALQRTWQECLQTTKKTSKPTKSAKSTKTEQKNKTSKTNHSDKSRNHKSKSRPKLDKRPQSQMSNAWSYDPQMMYNQQVPGNYGMPPQPLPAYVYGNPQMMPLDGVYRGQHNASSMRSATGASANVQYMLGRGFDPRLHGQMHQTNAHTKRARSKSHPELDYLIFEENEEGKEDSAEEGGETAYVPSTPSNATPRTRIHSNDKSPRRRDRGDGQRSPLSDAPSSPIYDELSSDTINGDVMLNSLGRDNKPVQKSQPQNPPPPQRDQLARRKPSAISVSPDVPAPIMLTDVWNNDTPTEIDRYMLRRQSVQDNRKAVLQSFQEMESKMARKNNSITNSIKSIFRRRKSVTVSSRVEEIPETSYNQQEQSPVRLNQRRASAAAVLNYSYDENGDPCSAV